MNKNIGVCRDCFAFKPSRCSVLTEMICKTRKCSFYRTRKQFIEGLKKYPPREDSGFNIKRLEGL